MADSPMQITDDSRPILEHLAAGEGVDARRAAALLAVADGRSYAEAAAAHDLTAGQVGYIVRKYREQGLAAFPEAATPVVQGASLDGEAEELRRVIDELNARVNELQQMVDARPAADSTYSPAGLLVMVRDSVQRLTPEMQLDVLRNFQGMSAEDLVDLDTWKGLAYMMTYSARFQAGQVRDKVSDAINHVVPEPIQPGRLWQAGKSGLDRITPEFAKQILGTFQGASREDLLDPNTWKGVWYMINYSLRFKAEQLKQRLSSAEETES